jgi:hypothetical protein
MNLLWRWSTSVQLTSLVMIAIFFWMLARSIRTAALRWWVRAWLWNLVALAITIFYWFLLPPSWLVHALVAPVYMGAKTDVHPPPHPGRMGHTASGPAALRRPVRSWRPGRLRGRGRPVPTVPWIGVVQHTVMGPHPDRGRDRPAPRLRRRPALAGRRLRGARGS